MGETSASKIVGNRMILTNILGNLTSKTLLPLRSISKEWNEVVLEFVKKRQDLSIRLSSDTGSNSWSSANVLIGLLNSVTLPDTNGERINDQVLKAKTLDFLRKNEETIVELRLPRDSENLVPVHTIWNELNLPKLSLVEYKASDEIEGAPFWKPRSGLKAMKVETVPGEDEHLLQRLLQACTKLEKLTIVSGITNPVPKLSFLSTESLQVLILDKGEEADCLPLGNRMADNINCCLEQYKETLKELHIHSFGTPEEKETKNEMEQSPFQSRTSLFGLKFPKKMTALTKITIDASIISAESRTGESPFPALKGGKITGATNREEYMEVLKLFCNATSVEINPYCFDDNWTWDAHIDILKVLRREFENLKYLKTSIVLIQRDSDALSINCHDDIHTIVKKQLKVIKHLIRNGLEHVDLDIGFWQVDDEYEEAEKNIVEPLLTLGRRAKRVRVVYFGRTLFNYRLENYLKEKIDQEHLPLSVTRVPNACDSDQISWPDPDSELSPTFSDVDSDVLYHSSGDSECSVTYRMGLY